MGRSSKILVRLLVIIPMSFAASCAASGTNICRTECILPFPVGEALAEWSVYTDEQWGFQIKYPPTFHPADVPDTLVTNGAVVTFVPAYAPSVNHDGDRTNLIALSVTIGVSDLIGAPAMDVKPGGLNDSQTDMCGLYPRFVRSCQSEGAAGSRYETIVLATTLRGKRYEIAFFMHSANPGCYSAGTITSFDAAETVRLFMTMAGTFSLGVKGASCLVE